MDIAHSLVAIGVAVTLGAISPGPSFLMVARTAIARSRVDAVAVALGMGAGGVVFAGLAMLGVHLVLGAVPWIYLALKLMGGTYLIILGCAIWRHAATPLHFPSETGWHARRTLLRSFCLGLVTQLSNPKTAVVYASIFVSLLPPDVPPGTMLAVPLLVFVIEAAWYSVVAVAFSTAHPRAAYLRWKGWIDRTAGAVMALLGTKLIASAQEA